MPRSPAKPYAVLFVGGALMVARTPKAGREPDGMALPAPAASPSR